MGPDGKTNRPERGLPSKGQGLGARSGETGEGFSPRNAARPGGKRPDRADLPPGDTGTAPEKTQY
ncbi:hypothetical protein SAE02_61350 [Skermanella aerolata]|uniref:Uncharacterized protein n=1 Tax=Skermanella aerolata TaxID=393310 RepID=A0A512DZS4_9PROT|nr:hypothetical protein SAE02_61350 [Skermanella aerolata]